MSKPAILCVDNEVIILNSLRRQIKQFFNDLYSYESAESADEALEIIAELQGEGIDVIVIVSDWLMPGMKGDDFLVQVHQNFPRVVNILLTGQADEAVIVRAQKEANLHHYIAKPWDDQELVDCIKSGLETLGFVTE